MVTRTGRASDPGMALRMLLLLLAVTSLAIADGILTITHSLRSLNVQLTRDVYRVERGWLNSPMVAFTLLGEDPPLDIFALIVALWAMRRGKGRDGWILIGVAVAARVIGVALKYAVAQPRPYFIVPPHPLSILHGYGYPSGHALLSMAILGFGCAVIVRLLASAPWRVFTLLISSTLIVLIGFSRVYLGIHWVNDVVGGYLDGGVVALSGATLHAHLVARMPGEAS